MGSDKELFTISEAAKILGVSVDTLRRWDKSGKLVAIRKEGGTHRYYTKRDLDLVGSDLFKLANGWAFSGGELLPELYCSNSAVFQARLARFQDAVQASGKAKDFFSLIVAVAGEIGNNSFDHNLGSWPDVPGIFFGHDIAKGLVVLADRGLGILHTLRPVKPSLTTHQEALRVAFSEVISGRAPEARGNGLKFVRKVVAENPVDLFFQSGDAELRMSGGQTDLHITRSGVMLRGCLAKLKF